MNSEKITNDMNSEKIANETGEVGDLHNTEKLSLNSFQETINITTPDCVIKKTEMFDADVMAKLLHHNGLSSNEKAQLKKYYKRRRDGNKVDVEYDLKDYSKAFGMGRLYTENPKHSISLQGFSKDIRSILAQKHYHDLDIVNAHPVILLQFCKSQGYACQWLEHYVSNREEVLMSIHKHFDISIGDAKALVNAICNLGNPVNLVDYNTPLPFIEHFKREIQNIVENVWKGQPSLTEMLKRAKKYRKSSCMSFLLQTEENKILLEINKYLESKNRKVDVFIFDGCLVRKATDDEVSLPNDLITGCQDYIKKVLGYDVKLKVKPLVSSLEFNQVEYGDIENIFDGITRPYAAVKKEFEKKHFKVKHPLCYCEITDDKIEIMSEDTFKKMYRNLWVMTDELPMEKFVDRWMNDPFIRTYDKMDICPPPMACPPNVYNMWNGFAVERMNVESSGNVEPFLDLVRLLVNHDAKSFEFLLMFLAATFKYPGRLQGVAPIFRGQHGVGKNRFTDTLSLLVGEDKFYSTSSPTKDIFGRFSTGRLNRFFINIDETKGKESVANCEEYKNAITALKYNFEQKNVTPITLTNFNRFIYTTNQDIPIKIEPGDRRYFIMDVSSEKKGDKPYWEAYSAYIEDERNLKAIYEYMLTIDVSKVNWIRDRPQTEATKGITALFVPDITKFLINIAKICPNDVLRYSSSQFFKMFEKWWDANKKRNTNVGGRRDDEELFTMTHTKFGIIVGRFTEDRSSGIEKKKSNVIDYVLNTQKIRIYMERDGVFDLDYNFKGIEFMGHWCGKNYEPDEPEPGVLNEPDEPDEYEP